MIAHRRSIFVTGLACFVAWLWNPTLFAEVRVAGEFANSQTVRTVADGTLHNCQIVSLDRTIAVGDRGLILLSINGGKNWTVQHHRSDTTLYDVHFENEFDGCIVGGSIEPFTHRSQGTILTSSDGGTTWQNVDSQLPRLLGIRSLSNKHLVAWGDWSVLYQSALFESFDKGMTWSSIAIPCGPLRSMAINKSDHANSIVSMLLVDRLGRCYTTTDRQAFLPVEVPTSPYAPFLFCEHDGKRWWLGGEKGQLYVSEDGQHWQQAFLPGSPRDHELISIYSMTARGETIWVAGNPGSVVWKSSNGGASWSTLPTKGSAPIHSLHALNDQIVVGCGPLATVSVSRNSGQAWWTQHQSGSRVGTLNLASTSDGVAWDAMAFLHEESRRTVGSIVVHDQSIEKKSSHIPDPVERNRFASQLLGLTSCTTWSAFPVSANVDSPRVSDFEHYRNVGSLHASPESTLVRKLIQEIRLQSPDLLITDCPHSGTQLQKNLADAVELAAAWSPRKDLQLYSSESGIPNAPWTVQRILFRGTKSGSLQFPSSMLLKKSGSILGESLVVVDNIVQEKNLSTNTLAPRTVTYRTIGSKFSTLKEPLEGLTLSAHTQRFEKPLGVGRPTTILATAVWFNTRDFVAPSQGNVFIRDRNWEERLQQSMKKVEPATRGPVLLEIAEKNRRLGNWNHWSSALELLLAEVPESPVMEAAYRELLIHLGSAEVQRLVQTQLQQVENRSTDESGQFASTVPVSSPFAKQNEQTWVQQAAFAHAPRRIPIAVSNGIPEVRRLLSRFPDSWAFKKAEPEWGWLIAARYRLDQTSRKELPADAGDYSAFWPRTSASLLHWQQVVNEEQLLLRGNPNRAASSSPSKTWPKTQTRPFLDGLKNESTWNDAVELTLQDPWGQSQQRTVLSLARDDEFLYLFSRCESNVAVPPSQPVVERRRDSILPEQEHVRFRIDLDRDYCSWFEFGWNRRGEILDQCNDMLLWDPQWYVAITEHDRGWQAEIAIPLDELLGQEQRSPLAWAVNAIHSQPNAGSRTMAPAISDNFQDDQWTILTID
jgi:photosystem II stability/assembly factor-like uncharacterized protein